VTNQSAGATRGEAAQTGSFRDYRVVDTHVHAGLTRYEPIESLVDQMFRHGVDQAVLVQHLGVFDQTYLIECAQRYPGRFAIVCLVDVQQPDAADRLSEWVERSPAIQGVHLLFDRLLGGAPGAEALCRRADELGLIVTVGASLRELVSPEADAAFRRFKRARVHLEHLAHPNPMEAPPFETYRRALALAQYEHIALKVSAFYSFTKLTWSPYVDTIPYFEMALQAFGARRLMWGSDYPTVSYFEGYHNCLRFVAEVLPVASQEERAYLLGETALSYWRFDARA